MPKCAVVMSYKHIVDFCTQGWCAERIEVATGLPRDSVLVNWFVEPRDVLTFGTIELPKLILVFQYHGHVELREFARVMTPFGEELPVAEIEFKALKPPKEQAYTFTIDKPGKLRIKTLGNVSVSTNAAEGMGSYYSHHFLPYEPLPYGMEEWT